MPRVAIYTGFIMGTIMSFIMSAIITAVNTGLDEGFLIRWAGAFLLAWVCATPLATLLGPASRKLAMKMAGPIDGSQ